MAAPWCSEGVAVTRPADQIELINAYNEWRDTIKREKFDDSPEMFLKWKAREDAIERLVAVADYVTDAVPGTDMERALLNDIKHLVEGRAT